MELGGVRWTSPTTGHSLLSGPTSTILSVIKKCLQLSLTSLSDKSGRLHCTLSHQVPSKTYDFTAWATMIIKDSARCCCQAPCHNGSAQSSRPRTRLTATLTEVEVQQAQEPCDRQSRSYIGCRWLEQWAIPLY